MAQEAAPILGYHAEQNDGDIRVGDVFTPELKVVGRDDDGWRCSLSPLGGTFILSTETLLASKRIRRKEIEVGDRVRPLTRFCGFSAGLVVARFDCPSSGPLYWVKWDEVEAPECRRPHSITLTDTPS